MIQKMLQENILIRWITIAIGGLVCTLFGLLNKDLPLIVDMIAEELPKRTVLIITGIVALLWIPTLFFLYWLYRQLQKVEQEPKFIDKFGVKWKYYPNLGKYEEAIYCLCHEPPKPCRIVTHSSEPKRRYICPEKKNPVDDDHIYLQEQSGNYLSFDEAYKRLQK